MSAKGKQSLKNRPRLVTIAFNAVQSLAAHLLPGEPAGGPQQHLAILGVAFAIQP